MKGISVKTSIISIMCAALLIGTIGCQNAKQQTDKTSPESDKEKLSYAIGADMAQSLSNIKDEIDLAMLQKGMGDKFTGKELLVSDEEAKSLLQALNTRFQAKQQEEFAKAAQDSLVEGKAWLEDNKTKEGVITTESGLQYKILKEGEGKSPKASDTVKVHYEGTRLDGTVFDSSYKRGEPVTFPVNGVIKGWTEGLQLMKEGGKYKLFVPADLAYGESGAGQQIKPNEVLLFDVELLEVIDDQKPESKPQEAM
jgi:FKBP-type peptidyl-prolyl cis-trans isomerase